MVVLLIALGWLAMLALFVALRAKATKSRPDRRLLPSRALRPPMRRARPSVQRTVATPSRSGSKSA
jgi:hypothetical protein